jgi:hypothetical protein
MLVKKHLFPGQQKLSREPNPHPTPSAIKHSPQEPVEAEWGSGLSPPQGKAPFLFQCGIREGLLKQKI